MVRGSKRGYPGYIFQKKYFKKRGTLKSLYQDSFKKTHRESKGYLQKKRGTIKGILKEPW